MTSSDKPNDRKTTEQGSTILPKPQIEIIVDGNSVFKPGMKTYFVDDYGETDEHTGIVIGEYCSCDTVAVTVPSTVCTCDSVCTCESVCSCVSYTKPSSGGNSGGHTVSCGSPCACVPVH